MSIPVRCFSCGVVTGDKWESFVRMLQEGWAEGDALTELGLQRPCCKRMLITHMPLMDQLLVRFAIDPTKQKHSPTPEILPARPSTNQLRRMPSKIPACPL